METIIVTGGAGYIGSHTLIELLTRTNFNVISIDNYSNSTPLTYERVKMISNRSFDFIEVDLCNKNELFAYLEKIENLKGIVHFAAFKSVPDSMADPLLYYHNNLVSLSNLLEFCKLRKVNNFIFSSSCSVYGNADVQPVTEETPLKTAESAYGHTKQIGEEMIRFFCLSQPWFKTVLLRYFNPVGAHPSGLNGELPLNTPTNLLPIITQTAIGKNKLTVFGDDYDTRDGSCIRDYIHVSDIAEAHVLALQKLLSGELKDQESLFNLGTGNGVTVLEVIRSFEKVSGVKLPFHIGERRAGDVVKVYANNNLAKKSLGWNPRYGLDEMTASAWKWQLKLQHDQNA